jgi:ArsR family transcriptional regulator, zinc-responsive transcriptional repressor
MSTDSSNLFDAGYEDDDQDPTGNPGDTEDMINSNYSTAVQEDSQQADAVTTTRAPRLASGPKARGRKPGQPVGKSRSSSKPPAGSLAKPGKAKSSAVGVKTTPTAAKSGMVGTKLTPTAAKARNLAVRRAAMIIKQASDGTRLSIMMMLFDGERNVAAICKDLGQQSQPAVSHHLALLRHGRLVEPRRDGKNNIYSLTDEGRLLIKAVQPFIDEIAG